MRSDKPCVLSSGVNASSASKTALPAVTLGGPWSGRKYMNGSGVGLASGAGGLGVNVGWGVRIGSGVGVDDGCGVWVAVASGIGVYVGPGVRVDPGVEVGREVCVGVTVGVGDGLVVGVCVGIGTGVDVDAGSVVGAVGGTGVAPVTGSESWSTEHATVSAAIETSRHTPSVWILLIRRIFRLFERVLRIPRKIDFR